MHYSFIKVRDFLPDFMQEFSNGFPNIQNNFGHYLLHLVFGGIQEDNIRSDDNGNTSNSSTSMWPRADNSSNRNLSSKIYNREQFLKRVVRKCRPDVKPLITLDELLPYFMEECARKFVRIDQYFASYLLHLLIRDADDGLDFEAKTNKLNVCKLEQFLERCLTKYANPLDATISNMRMCYYYKRSRGLELDYVKKKYQSNSTEKLNNLIRSILQYPENSNPKQLEEMFVKMQIFIITNYCIGCPKNHVLLKQTRQSLNSVLGKGDLQKYVIKKRYHRLEYLRRLGATVCGILIFNNQGKSEIMRNVFLDLQMAQRNTKDSLDDGFKRVALCIQKGTNAMQTVIKLNIAQQKVQCLWPITKVREINKFVILFHVYKRCLEQIKDAFEKTQHLIGVTQKKFNCVVAKIDEILKFRSAIEAELIFPHFVYLSEVWTSLILYLNHLVEINKIKDHLDELLNENMETHYHEIVDDISTSCKKSMCPMEQTFEELMPLTNEIKGNIDIMKLKHFVKDYCSLTIALTKGLLVPSQLDRKLPEILEKSFGFVNIECAKYSEKHFSHFITAFGNAIFTSVDLILFLQLDDEVLQQDFDLVKQSVAKKKTLYTQSVSSLSTANSINVTWNVWDYHRQTIRLADIRRRQTNSTQTNVSFGKNNSQNQSHNARDHVGDEINLFSYL